jgi:predicted kinase
MFVIFDLDGTLADISHRVHFVRGTKKPDWESFFAACVDDLPHQHVIETFKAHLDAGHKVRVWSARSDVVRSQTEDWLDRHGIDPRFLQHMRAAGDNTPDATLKRHWLHQEYVKPDIVYDDRQRVVDMWRSEGVPCFQVVADWEDEGRKIEPVSETLLTVMVGPSGAGKSTYARGLPGYISSDELRVEYTGDFADQTRNDDVFTALHRIAKARLDCGLPVCIDATNLLRRDRLACVALAPAGSRIEYVVIDRPLADKMANRGWRPEWLIEKHHQRMQSCAKDIMAGDGLPNVSVIDLRTYAMEKAA